MHYQGIIHAKCARLYSQMMLDYEKDPKFRDTIFNYKDCGEMLSDILIMSGLAFGQTCVSSRHTCNHQSHKVNLIEDV